MIGSSLALDGTRSVAFSVRVVYFVAREGDIGPAGVSDELQGAHVQDARLDGLLRVAYRRLVLCALATATITPCWLRLLY